MQQQNNKRRALSQVVDVSEYTPQARLPYQSRSQEIYDAKQQVFDETATRRIDAMNVLIKTCMVAGISVLLLIAFLVALVGNLHLFIDTTGALMSLVLHWLTPGVLSVVAAVLLARVIKEWRIFQLHNIDYRRARAEVDAINDENSRRNKMVNAEVLRMTAEAALRQAEATKLLMTHNLDEQGNLLYRDPLTGYVQLYSGNMREHPALHSMSYSNKIDGGKALEQIPQFTGDVPKPTIDEIVAHVKRNSFEIVLGRSLRTREFIMNELTDAHIKLIGGSRMGKSCEAGAIIQQVTETHDVKYLQIALLDLENKTSKLFENDVHVLTLNTGYKKVKMHARNTPQVAEYMVHLHDEMKRRYLLDDDVVDELPRILVYLEEFLYWKKMLKLEVAPELREKALAAFAGLATRGLKVGIHLMACAQVDYADEELRDAMAQFLAINLSFSVRPSAAQAAGFVESELLKENFRAKKAGQFVVESVGGSDLGVAPDYNVKAKLKLLPKASSPVMVEELPTLPSEIESEIQQKPSRNMVRNTVEPALRAKIAQVMEIPGETMAETIKRVWDASPGNGPKYQKAKQEYLNVAEVIHAMAKQAMEGME